MNVSIRPLRPDDADQSFRWRNDPSIWTYTLAFGRNFVVTAEIERDWIVRTSSDPQARRFAILADGEYVGNIYLTDIADGVAQYHVFIGNRTVWGRGVARDATRRILSVAWDDLDLDAVYLFVHPDNEAGVRLYSRIGFAVTGHDALGTETNFVRMELRNPRRVG